MKAQIVNSKAQLTPENIKPLQAEIGLDLPDDYRAFLLRHNGGRPKPSGFSFVRRGCEEAAMVGDFYAIQEGSPVDLLKKLRTFGSRIPPAFLPVACDPGGDQILLGLMGEQRGKVYYWIHDLDEDAEDETDPRNLGLIAGSFQEFLEALDELRA
jgi:cell wall assembly regulator SMI1